MSVLYPKIYATHSIWHVHGIQDRKTALGDGCVAKKLDARSAKCRVFRSVSCIVHLDNGMTGGIHICQLLLHRLLTGLIKDVSSGILVDTVLVGPAIKTTKFISDSVGPSWDWGLAMFDRSNLGRVAMLPSALQTTISAIPR